MKAGTAESMKFLVLKNQLRIPKYKVIGILDGLWYLTSLSAQDGAIGKFSDEEIAAWLEYDGDPGELIDHLVSRKFLDRCPVHRLIVHDWPQHCPKYIEGILKRHNKPFATIQDAPIGTSYSNVQIADSHSNLLPSLVLSRQVNSSQGNTSLRDKVADSNESPPAISESTDPPQKAKPAKRNPDAEIVIPPALAAEPFLAAWSAWISVRRENRWSCRESCLSKQLDSLSPLGPRLAADCIQTSIRNGWQGIFPEKMNGANNGKRSVAVGAGQIYDPAAEDGKL